MLAPDAELGIRRVADLLEPQLRPWQIAATLFLILGVLGLRAAAILASLIPAWRATHVDPVIALSSE